MSMSPAATRLAPVSELQKRPEELLDDVLTNGIGGDVSRARDLDGRFIQDVVAAYGKSAPKSALKAIDLAIADIDARLSEQVNVIIHAPQFQRLEATWRGLHRFVKNSETGESLKIQVLNATKKDLAGDFENAADFSQSALWKKAYGEGLNTFGGDPVAALIGDYEFDRSAQDVELLTQISQVAAAAHAPFISAAGAGMFGLDSLTKLPNPRSLKTAFDKSNPDNAKWLSFRDSEDSRFVALCVPHVLQRMPYGKNGQRVDAFAFEEDVAGEHDHYLWGNAAYAFAGRLTEAFAKYHWCARIIGPQGGGMVTDLPIHTFRSREGDVGSKVPTEVTIEDDRDKELSDLGFIGLLNEKNTDRAAFFSATSAQRPKKYDKAEATASAQLSSQLEYLFVTSRMAHYLKAMCRDKVGDFMSRQDCENFLNKWVRQYRLDNDDAPPELKAKRPLREVNVEVTDDKARPGCYRAVMHVRPHLHLANINVSLRLVADLPAPAKS